MSLRQSLIRFLRDEDGVVLTEFLLLLPIMIWAFISLFVYWDAFRTINEAQKASYAISDLLSRQQNNVTPAFVDGMDDLIALITTDVEDIRLRISSLEWDMETDAFLVLFSRSPGSRMTPLTGNQIDSYRDKIPLMADHDSVILLELEVDYRPFFDIGVNSQTFTNEVVTRPRFRRRICLIGELAKCPASLSGPQG